MSALQESVKSKIISLLSSVDRNGISELINYLTNSDYFVAPASTKYHGNVKGGLAQHCLSVYNILKSLSSNVELTAADKSSSLEIIAFLHDLSKVNFYKEDDEKPTQSQVKYLKSFVSFDVDNLSKKKVAKLLDYYTKKTSVIPDLSKIEYSIIKPKDGERPYLPHSLESIFRINKFIELTDVEYLCIYYHMGNFSSINTSDEGASAYNEAKKYSKLVELTHLADYTDSILDGKI